MALFKTFVILSVLCSLIIQPSAPATDHAHDAQAKADVATVLVDVDHYFDFPRKLPPMPCIPGHHCKKPLLHPPCPKRCKCPPPPPPPCPKKCPKKCPPPPKKKPKPPPPCPKHCKCPIPPPPPPKCPLKCKCPPPPP